MSTFKRCPSRLRGKNGANIAELPPALLILFFFFFFPAINILYLSFAFGVGWFLNNIELRSIACHTPTSLGLPYPPTGLYNPAQNLPESVNWKGLMGVTEDSAPEVAQFPAGGAAVISSQVKTTVSITPLFIMPAFKTMPFFGQIPGLGKPLNLTYVGTIQQEEPGP